MTKLFSYAIAFCLLCSSLNGLTFEEKVIELIDNSQEVPGLKSDEFTTIRPELKRLWNRLCSEHAINIRGADSKLRPYFVTLQGLVEHVLAHELNQSVFELKAVIHTPMPATPLCTNGSISKELVDPSIMKDPLRLFTVKARTTILRDYLHLGGRLFMAYPKDGLNQRTATEQQIYQKELSSHAANLFDLPLKCAAMPEDLVGAFYLFKDSDGKFFVFAIRIPQANKPLEDGQFGLRFGPLNHPDVHQTIANALTFLKTHSSHPGIQDMLETLQKEIPAKL